MTPIRPPGGPRPKKKRSASSDRWLRRQRSDPYVAEAKRRGYRSRAAFKLIELDDRFRLLRAGARVVDLGAAPGGWTQVAVERVRPGASRGAVVAVDIAGLDPIPGAEIITADIFAPELADLVRQHLQGPADIVLSDMAPSASGHAGADHLRIIGLAEAALDLATAILAPGGSFVCKVWQGGATPDLLAALKRRFATVRHAKPPASRAASAEVYVVATGFRAEPDGSRYALLTVRAETPAKTRAICAHHHWTAQMAKPSTRGEIEARIERIAALIAGARRLIDEGRPLDLSVLAFAIADLREAVRAAPTASTDGLAPRLVALRATLDALGEDVEKTKPAPSPETRRAAIRAYDGGRKD